jgi:hypothetical protein
MALADRRARRYFYLDIYRSCCRLAARLFSGLVCGLIGPKTTAPKAAHVTISKEGVMKQVQYCGYTIDVSATLEDFDQQSWSLTATISWAHGRQRSEIQGRIRFVGKKESEEHALELAKSWVDKRMGDFQPAPGQSARIHRMKPAG